MSVYYNDNDPYCAQWLRNLIAAGHLPAGEIDERPIQSVTADDVRRFRQCHFFAGIGGWPLALELAGWGERDVWTGSCPCQPFSAAGNRRGTNDERHLWLEFARLIGECRPSIIFGEQVDKAIEWSWLDGVQDDMEALGYAFGKAILPAAGVGAPHARHRIYFVADSKSVHGSERMDIHGRQQSEIQQGDGSEVSSLWLAPPTPADCMADGISGQVELVRAYGNALVPSVAAEFIRAAVTTQGAAP